MGNFYLDIETTGFDPQKDKIITIQFMELDRNTGEKIGDITILKEWELGEKECLEQFITQTNVTDPYPFSFISIGFNLSFEHKFLSEKSKTYGLGLIDITNRPHIDLRHIGVIMNRGEFRGSGLDKLTGKPHSGTIIPQWYYEKKYSDIENYIKVEALEFATFNSWLYSEMPEMLTKFKTAHNIF